MDSPIARFSFWYAALTSVGSADAGRMVPPGSLPIAWDKPARRMAENVAVMDAAVRRQLLEILRAKADAAPWSAIDASWMKSIVRDWPPQWKLWALDSLPASAREQLQRSLNPTKRGAAGGGDKGRSPQSAVVAEGHMPDWWPAWFARHVKKALDYPDLPPWVKHSEVGLPGSLWERDSQELLLIMRLHGTSGLVACLRHMPRPEGQQLIWQLPADFQTEATEVVQAKKWTDDPFWPQIFGELTHLAPVLGDRLQWMALADWVRAGMQQEQTPYLERLAYRLPRKYGKWMLQQMAARPEWTSLAVQPSIESWRQKLGDLLTTLGKEGRIRASAGTEAQTK